MYEANAHSSSTEPLIAETVFVLVSLAKCAVCCKYLCALARLQGNIYVFGFRVSCVLQKDQIQIPA